MGDQFGAFVFTISGIYKSIQRIKSREMSKLGLRGAHSLYIYHLMKHPGGLTAAELSQLCQEDKAAVSRALAKLAGDGLIAYAGAEESRRYRRRAVLTDKGRGAAQRVSGLIAENVRLAQADMDDKSRAEFYSSLEEVAENLRRIAAQERRDCI